MGACATSSRRQDCQWESDAVGGIVSYTDLPPTQKINLTLSSTAGEGWQRGATGMFVRMPPSAPPEGVSACSAFSPTILQKSGSHEIPHDRSVYSHFYKTEYATTARTRACDHGADSGMRPRRGLGHATTARTRACDHAADCVMRPRRGLGHATTARTRACDHGAKNTLSIKVEERVAATEGVHIGRRISVVRA